MKILSIGDLHLGKIVNGYSLLTHQIESLNQVKKALRDHQVDLLMITGDLYDRAIPPKEAIKVFDSFLNDVLKENIKVSYIAGNHDSYERTSFLSDVLKGTSLFIGKEFDQTIDSFTLKEGNQTYRFYLIPFMPYQYVREILNDDSIDCFQKSYEAMLKTIELNDNEINLLMTHAFIGHSGINPEVSDSEKTLAVGGLDFVDSQLFEAFDYTLLGHIHKPQSVYYDNVRYTGSIYKYSFSEETHQKSMLLLEINSKEDIKQTLIPIHMSKEWHTLSMSFDEIINNEAIISKHQNDYVRIRLTDEIDVSDGVARLKQRFLYLMEFSYQKDAAFVSLGGAVTDQLAKEMLNKENPEKTMRSLFIEFSRTQANLELDEVDLKIVEETIEELIRGNNDEN